MPKKVAICWELGGGSGHFSKSGPLFEYFKKKEFQRSFITRDVFSAGRWFEAGDLTLYQAPFRHGSGLQYTSTPTFAHVLHNVGYADADGLFALAESWKSLLELIRPDLIVADHSPTAILAARKLSIPTLICGSGFACPPDESPLPDLQPWLKSDPVQLASTETRVLDCLNAVLDRWNRPPLDRVSQLYHDGPQKLLLTFRELDHFPNREGERYFGYWPFQNGQQIEWPAGAGPKLFAYLKRSPKLANLLVMLGRSPFRTVVHVGGDSRDLKGRFQTPTLRISDRMVDLANAGRSSDLAMTNGNLGTTTAMLLSGIPVLALPLHFEQLLIGKAVERMGAGAAVSLENIPSCQKALSALAREPRFREAADAFESRYRDFNQETYRARIEDQLDSQLCEIV